MARAGSRGRAVAIAVAAGLAACAVAPTPADAGTFRHDVPGDVLTHINYGDGFHMVGGVQLDFSSFGSGVVIDRQWVLTSAHVVAGFNPGSYVKFETDPDPDDPAFDDPNFDPDDWESIPLSGLFRVDAMAIHEFYDNTLGPAGGFDIAVLHLDAPITHTHPDYQPYARFRGSDEVGRVGTAVGFGATGTGKTGFDINTGAFFRFAGDNVIDADARDPRVRGEFVARTVTDPVTGEVITFTQEQIASQFLLSDFDDGPTRGDDPETAMQDESHVNDGLNPLGGADPLALEYSVAPGDSGGPLLIDVDGQLQVAGLNTFIYGLPPADGGDGTDNASYSDLAGYLRVSMFNDWIDGVLGLDPFESERFRTVPTDGAPTNPGSLGLEAAALPEPAALSTVCLGAALLLRRPARRRRK